MCYEMISEREHLISILQSSSNIPWLALSCDAHCVTTTRGLNAGTDDHLYSRQVICVLPSIINYCIHIVNIVQKYYAIA